MEPLPEPLPAEPFALLLAWLAEAEQRTASATAMTLATVEPDGRPSARMVVCRRVDAAAGWFAFYTDRDSDKGRALAADPRAALVFHWPELERQVRVEGPVTLAPEADSDAYWASRPLDARLAAVASAQSQPLTSPAALLDRLQALRQRHPGGAVPRPARWGGYRVWAERVELWVSQPARAHDRAVWTRRLVADADGYRSGAWSRTRLQP